MEFHPNIRRVEHLIGVWAGDGSGHYPTIEDFSFAETVTFSAIPGKPFLRYEQKTKGPKGPMHTELGFLRPVGGDDVEFVLAQPTGHTELLTGTITADGLEFDGSEVVSSPTAKHVEMTRRTYTLIDGGSALRCEFFMAAVGQPMQQHLESTLRRQEP